MSGRDTEELGIPLCGAARLLQIQTVGHKDIFKSCNFAVTRERLAGRIQSSPPAGPLTLGSVLGGSSAFFPASCAEGIWFLHNK